MQDYGSCLVVLRGQGGNQLELPSAADGEPVQGASNNVHKSNMALDFLSIEACGGTDNVGKLYCAGTVRCVAPARSANE
jgi:hypothetical protein